LSEWDRGRRFPAGATTRRYQRSAESDLPRLEPLESRERSSSRLLDVFRR